MNRFPGRVLQADDSPVDAIQADDFPVDAIQADDFPADAIQADDSPADALQVDDPIEAMIPLAEFASFAAIEPALRLAAATSAIAAAAMLAVGWGAELPQATAEAAWFAGLVPPAATVLAARAVTAAATAPAAASLHRLTMRRRARLEPPAVCRRDRPDRERDSPKRRARDTKGDRDSARPNNC